MKKYNKNIKTYSSLSRKDQKKYKQSLPASLPQPLFDICWGVILGDATISRSVFSGCRLKVEQSYKHEAYVYELFKLFKDWTFMPKPRQYIPTKGKNAGQVRSVVFSTFAHPAFDIYWEWFKNEQGQKVYKEGLITQYLTYTGLSYWIADDGSLHAKKKSLTLHTEGFTFKENLLMCEELNSKFLINSRVHKHNKNYYIIYIPAVDVIKLCDNLCLPFSMKRKGLC